MKITREWLKDHLPCESGGAWGLVFLGSAGRDYEECLSATAFPDWLLWLIAKVEGLDAVSSILGRLSPPRRLSTRLLERIRYGAEDWAEVSFMSIMAGDLAFGYACQFQAQRLAYFHALDVDPHKEHQDAALKLAQGAVNALAKSHGATDDVFGSTYKEAAKSLCLDILAARAKIATPR